MLLSLKLHCYLHQLNSGGWSRLVCSVLICPWSGNGKTRTIKCAACALVLPCFSLCAVCSWTAYPPAMSICLEVAHNRELKKIRLQYEGAIFLFWLQGRKQVRLVCCWCLVHLIGGLCTGEPRVRRYSEYPSTAAKDQIHHCDACEWPCSHHTQLRFVAPDAGNFGTRRSS